MSKRYWRVQTDDTGSFDELVINLTKTKCIHIECMGGNNYFVGLGDKSFSVGVRQGKIYLHDIDGSPGVRKCEG
jgi:hypothetical protein